MNYLVLFRGINVGGKNKLPMKELQAMFTDNGYRQVRTSINSGNLIFEAAAVDEAAVKAWCEAELQQRFQLTVSVMVLSAAAYLAAMAGAPHWWNREPESKHNAIFVIPPVTAADLFHEIGAGRPEYEQTAYAGQVIFWSAPLKTFSRTDGSRIVTQKSYDSITIRNAKTALKLAELLKENTTLA